MKGVRPFTDEEITTIKASFSGRYAARDRALFVVGLRTAFRISKLLSLRRKEVYGHGKVLDRVSVERKHMKKKTQGRTVLLHPEARAALSGNSTVAYLASFRDNEIDAAIITAA